MILGEKIIFRVFMKLLLVFFILTIVIVSWYEADGYLNCDNQNEIEVPLHGFFCVYKVREMALGGNVNAVERYVFHLSSSGIFEMIKNSDSRAWVMKCAEVGRCVYEVLSLCKGRVDGFDGRFLEETFWNAKKNGEYIDDIPVLEERYKNREFYPCIPSANLE